MSTTKYLPIYLNDHLAGSALGVSLAKRIAGSNEGNAYGAAIAAIAAEIEEDRRTLESVMQRFGAKRDRLKMLGLWAGEKAARLKLNGELLRYSPLSRMEELEMLSLGVEGKRSLWRALRHAIGDDPRFGAGELDALIARAESQRARIEELRLRASEEALAG